MSFRPPLQFSDQELIFLESVHDTLGPRHAFAEFYSMDEETRHMLPTEDVEDFIISFYEQFNNRFGEKY